MSESKELKPKQNFLTSALKAVKGDSTQQLIEDFTSEMTLVAEGLCDDQGRLRREVEAVSREQAHLETLLSSERDVQDHALTDLRKELAARQDEMKARICKIEDRLDDLEEGIEQIENKMKEKAKAPAGKKFALFKKDNLLAQITLLAAIVCGSWVLVTILGLFKK